MPQRLSALKQWLAETLEQGELNIEPASGDASFRRYFRIRISGQETRIAMDAPPDREDCRPFVTVAGQLAGIGLHVPKILAQDLQQGFLLLEDLGSDLYLDLLSDHQWVDRLYADALGALAVMQACGPRETLPPYDEALLRSEMTLFSDWLVARHLGLTLDPVEQQALGQVFDLLVVNALEQPGVFVHRDYHSRNLLRVSSNNPGIIDFQDAVVGPVTYDLVSLLRDCYVRWPRSRVEVWVAGYFELAQQSGIVKNRDEARFMRWFDLMGVQRHLKASGIFARLYHRDGKSGYLRDIPRTLNYILEVAPDYPELGPLSALLEQRVMPALERKGLV